MTTLYHLLSKLACPLKRFVAKLACPLKTLIKPTRDMVDRYLLRDNHDKIIHIQLRMLGVEPSEITETRVSRAIDFEAHLVNEQKKYNQILATLRTDILLWFASGSKTINVAYDITDSIQHILNPDTMLRIATSESIKWKKLTIAVYANVSH